jgi:ketosteroid isomerase-like protein
VERLIMRRRIRGVFDALSTGNYTRLLSGVARDVYHVFPGDHPLGGERHSKQAMKHWVERSYRLFPNLDFEVKDVVVRGWPWNTVVAVQWVDRSTPVDGEPYRSEGAHFIAFARPASSISTPTPTARRLPRHAGVWRGKAYRRRRLLPSPTRFANTLPDMS